MRRCFADDALEDEVSISIVVPVYNEEECIQPLYRAICIALPADAYRCELIFVNDGSTDRSTSRLDSLADADARIRVIHLRRNFGQTAALRAGLDQARAEIVVTLDADLQNDPRDIPAMITKLHEGYDLVHGWRRKRQDKYWTRRLPSRLANCLIARVTGLALHDLGCTLKVMRQPIARDLNLYGDMHRFIPVLAHWQGARIAEVPTTHHPRRLGNSKYGLTRTLRVLLDLITVQYLVQCSSSPMRWFGTMGIGCGIASAFVALVVLSMKLIAGFDLTGNPLLYVALLGGMSSLQFFSLGILGEMSSRIYYESQDRRPYAIRRISGQASGASRRAA